MSYVRGRDGHVGVFSMAQATERGNAICAGAEEVQVTELPIKVTGANAGGPRRLPTLMRWAARIAQFCR